VFLKGSISDLARESFSLVRVIRNNAREQRSAAMYEEKAREKFRLGMQDAWAAGGSAFAAQVNTSLFFLCLLLI
jgi:hypothetical protein